MNEKAFREATWVVHAVLESFFLDADSETYGCAHLIEYSMEWEGEKQRNWSYTDVKHQLPLVACGPGDKITSQVF